ncbi:MAG TPA: hypothetical protein VFV39_06605 [Limnobacter sp.]|nr:hypothetical protein [Limnobacter sp.]
MHTFKHTRQQGFIQAALLFGIALMTAILGGFALANRSPTSQTDTEQAKVNASVILKQGSDLRDGVGRYASDFGASAVINTLDFSATANTGLFDPAARYASPQIMPSSAFAGAKTIASPSAAAAGHWHLNKATPGNGLASGAADPMVALVDIREDVCGRVNTLLYGSNTIPTTGAAATAWTGGTDAGLSGVAGVSGWPEGCIETSDGDFVYFKVVQEN